MKGWYEPTSVLLGDFKALRAGVWITFGLLCLLAGGLAFAEESTESEEPPPDVMDLDLEELLRIRLIDAGVLGVHTHLAGEVMFGYRPMFMEMNGNRDGSRGLSDAQVLEQFPVAPTDMTMTMHMISVMYAPNDVLTWMLMAGHVELEMDHVTRMGGQFTTRTSTLTDTRVSALVRIWEEDRRAFLTRFGVSLPTGSVDERGPTPLGPQSKLPYPMQTGSGTYDAILGASYLVQDSAWARGIDADLLVRLGTNSEQYSLGDQVTVKTWARRKLSSRWSASGGLKLHTWGDIDGRDPELNPLVVPTARTDLRSGARIDALLSAEYLAPLDNGSLRSAVELEIPVEQDLDGPQLEVDWSVRAGIQWTFGGDSR